MRVTTHNTRRGFPIRRPSDHSSFISSPRLIADYRVLHRLLMPRHPPCALKNLPHDHRTHRYHHHHTPRGTAAVSRRSITNTAPQPTRHTPREGSDARLPAAPVLKMLASTIQFSNNNPHTLHTGGNTPRKGHDHRQDAGNLRHNTPTPHQRGRGLLSQDPIVRHGPHPPPDRFSSTTHTGGTPQGPPRWDRY